MDLEWIFGEMTGDCREWSGMDLEWIFGEMNGEHGEWSGMDLFLVSNFKSIPNLKSISKAYKIHSIP